MSIYFAIFVTYFGKKKLHKNNIFCPKSLLVHEIPGSVNDYYQHYCSLLHLGTSSLQHCTVDCTCTCTPQVCALHLMSLKSSPVTHSGCVFLSKKSGSIVPLIIYCTKKRKDYFISGRIGWGEKGRRALTLPYLDE